MTLGDKICDWCGTYETEEVQTAVAVLGPVKALEDGFVLVELPLLDRDVDAHNVLPHNAARANVQVAVVAPDDPVSPPVWLRGQTLTRLPSCP